MNVIVAVYDDWGIGRNGTQPIALSADRVYFRKTTTGSAIIVGRKTLEDFPGGRPLPKRVNIVLTRDRDFEVPGAVTAHSVEEALEKARDFENVFVIGGARVYGQLLPYCDTAYVTKVHAKPESDVFFPDLDRDPGWTLVSRTETQTENSVDYEFCVYKRL